MAECGVTVEKVEGAIRDHNLNIRLVDLPGTYRSDCIYNGRTGIQTVYIDDEVDMIIDVVDASH